LNAHVAGVTARGLLLLGFGGAFRRSELVALNVADLEETEDGLRVTIRRSKTDQEGQGVTIAIVRGGACCPVKALRAWLDAAGIMEGAVFRPVRKGGKVCDRRLAAKSVCNITKAYAGRVGLDGGGVRRPLVALGLPDQCRPPRRFDISSNLI
jgi:integrase